MQSSWIELIRCLMFGDVSSSRLGALPKARRQALHTGKRLAALLASRDWIPHPRERLKNALASALTLREALVQLEGALRDLDRGTECRALQAYLIDLGHVIDAKLASHEYAGLACSMHN